ncbi:MAG: hypothetical protein V3U45_08355 [bacterium]
MAAKIDWKGLRPEILQAVDELDERGFVEPTVRAVYYVLSDTYGLIPGTPYGYKKLDAEVVSLRRSGDIPWGFFAVKRGRSVTASSFTSPEETAELWVEALKERHLRYYVPRWHHQDRLVEVWVEKDGLLGATRSWLYDLDVTVRAPQGYGAWEFVHEAMRDVADRLGQMESASGAVVLYLGDLDPSGKDIPRFLDEDAIAEFEGMLDGGDLVFETIALDPAQVEEFGLPDAPGSQDTMDKIRRDPRYRRFVEEWGEVFCELDSFYALRTEDARRTVREAVEAYFDEEAHGETEAMQEEGRDTVRELIREQVTFAEEEE